jgi:hypothetical protein
MEHRTNKTVCTGYLGNQGYVTPLHHISVIPGHSTPKIAVCDTGSTKLGMLVQVKCQVKLSLCQCNITGSLALSNLINLIHTSITNDGYILPDCFYVSVVEQPNHTFTPDLAPLTLGYEDTVAYFAGSEVTSRGPRGVYKVPLGCPSKRYRTPCGLGSTLVSNNVVLMHPNVPQYLVEKALKGNH